jgi:hypothetical protein
MVSISNAFKTFAKLDYLAPNVSLNVGGSSGFKTVIGAILTIAATLTFTLTSFIILQSYSRTDNPGVTEELRSGEVYPKIDFLQYRLLPIIYPYLDDVTPVKSNEVSKYATFVVSKTRYITVTHDDGSQEAKVERFIMDFKPCGDLLEAGKKGIYTPGPEAGYVYELTNDYGMCVDYHDTETYIQGRITDDVYEEISVEVYPCTLDDQAKCASESDISRLSFIYALGSVNADLASKESPLRPKMDADDYFYINTISGIQYQSRMMQTSIWDDEGYFFGTTLRDSFFSVEKTITSMATRPAGELYCKRSQITDRSCNWFYFFLYISGGKEARITRSYKEIISTMGDIGGVKEFLYFIAFMFYKYYNDYHRKRVMVAQVYNLEKESRGFACCKSKNQTDGSMGLQNKGLDLDQQIKLQEKAPGEVIDGAFELIEAKLDAVTMIRQLNELTVLTKHFLKTHHIPLVPAVALELEWGRSKTLNRFRQKESDNLDGGLGGYIVKPDVLKEAVISLQEKRDSEPVDVFFWKLLTESWVGGEGLQKGRPLLSWEGQQYVKTTISKPGTELSSSMLDKARKSRLFTVSRKSIPEPPDTIRMVTPMKVPTKKLKTTPFHPITMSKSLRPK